MNPENVNPSNFKVEHVLFNNGDFSIALGVWEDGSKRLAMRWNGQGDDPGYPKLFKNPVWFIVDDSLIIPIISSLINQKNANNSEIIDALQKVLIKKNS